MAWQQATDGIAVFQVRFPDAESVFAMGRFNDWSTTATPLRVVGNGLWELKLPSGLNLKDLCFYVLREREVFGRIRSHRLDAMVGQANAG